MPDHESTEYQSSLIPSYGDYVIEAISDIEYRHMECEQNFVLIRIPPLSAFRNTYAVEQRVKVDSSKTLDKPETGLVYISTSELSNYLPHSLNSCSEHFARHAISVLRPCIRELDNKEDDEALTRNHIDAQLGGYSNGTHGRKIATSCST